jgi:hypothetical protein
VVEIPAEDDKAQDAADSSGVVMVGEEDDGSSEMGGNLFGLLSFLVLVVLITVGKYIKKRSLFRLFFYSILQFHEDSALCCESNSHKISGYKRLLVYKEKNPKNILYCLQKCVETGRQENNYLNSFFCSSTLTDYLSLMIINVCK